MATYKVQDLINKLYEVASDGYEYVDIYELDGDEEDDMPVSLSFFRNQLIL